MNHPLTKTALTLSIVALSTALAVSAEAADPILPKPRPVTEEANLRPHIGILLGIQDPFGPLKPALNYGIDAGFQPMIPFGIGLQLARATTSSEFTGGEARSSQTTLLVTKTYNFGGDVTVLSSSYIGLGLGAAFDSRSVLIGAVESASTTFTRFAIAPVVGFDWLVASDWTVGPQLQYLGVIGPDSPDSLNLRALVKYWF